MKNYHYEYAQTLNAAYECADRIEEFITHKEHIPIAMITAGLGCWKQYIDGKDAVDFLKEQITEIELGRERAADSRRAKVVELHETVTF